MIDLSSPPSRPVLWEVQRHGETLRHLVLHQFAFGACANRHLLLSECSVERAEMMEPSSNPLYLPRKGAIRGRRPDPNLCQVRTIPALEQAPSLHSVPALCGADGSGPQGADTESLGD